MTKILTLAPGHGDRELVHLAVPQTVGRPGSNGSIRPGHSQSGHCHGVVQDKCLKI